MTFPCTTARSTISSSSRSRSGRAGAAVMRPTLLRTHDRRMPPRRTRLVAAAVRSPPPSLGGLATDPRSPWFRGLRQAALVPAAADLRHRLDRPVRRHRVGRRRGAGPVGRRRRRVRPRLRGQPRAQRRLDAAVLPRPPPVAGRRRERACSPRRPSTWSAARLPVEPAGAAASSPPTPAWTAFATALSGGDRPPQPAGRRQVSPRRLEHLVDDVDGRVRRLHVAADHRGRRGRSSGLAAGDREGPRPSPRSSPCRCSAWCACRPAGPGSAGPGSRGGSAAG